MRNKIIIIIISILVLSVAFVATLIQVTQRRDDEMFLRIVIWHDVRIFNNTPSAHYFVVRNDGTLISYRGNAHGHHDISRRNLMRSIEEREITSLGEEDFQAIHELLYNALYVWENPYLNPGIRDNQLAHLYHNGNVYNLEVGRSLYFHDLISLISRESPLEVRWHERLH